jgi:hypothetical protein
MLLFLVLAVGAAAAVDNDDTVVRKTVLAAELVGKDRILGHRTSERAVRFVLVVLAATSPNSPRKQRLLPYRSMMTRKLLLTDKKALCCGKLTET